jgi:hypothetical protein
LTVSVEVFGPVIVMLLAEAFVTFTGFAWVVAFVAVQTKLLLELNAGLKPVTVAVLGVPETKATLPLKIRTVELISVAEQVVVVPQSLAISGESVALTAGNFRSKAPAPPP